MVERRASSRASRSKRAMRSGSSANTDGSTLIATSRPRVEVGRPPHHAHAALADGFDENVVIERTAGSQGHVAPRASAWGDEGRYFFFSADHQPVSTVSCGGAAFSSGRLMRKRW